MRALINHHKWLGLILAIFLPFILSLSWMPARVRAEKALGPKTAAPGFLSALSLNYQWHTFFEGGFSTIALDNAGNIYTVGTTGYTWGSPLNAYSGGNDIVVMKFNRYGIYQWHTYYGAAPTESNAGDDAANSLVVDGDGNVYITGYSDSGWNVGVQFPLHPHDGVNENMFVLKLNASGDYQWHTFYQSGRAYSIALDSGWNIYVTGISYGGFAGWEHGTGPNGTLVVLKFNNNGALQWHSYYGNGTGEVDIVGYSIATDSADNVIITGPSTSNWLGDDNTPPLHPLTAGEPFSDIAILKLDSDGIYQWHTFFGGNGTDTGYVLTTSGEDIFIVGGSEGTWGSPLHSHAEKRDITIVKVNTNGQLQWNTFYGSNESDSGSGICVDANGDIYISGHSAASWMGDGGQAPRHAFSGDYDSIVLKLDSNGAYQQHTFYGSSGNDYTGVIALGGSDDIYVTGTSFATWQGDGDTDPLNPHSGNSLNGDGYILKLFDNGDYSVFLSFIRR